MFLRVCVTMHSTYVTDVVLNNTESVVPKWFNRNCDTYMWKRGPKMKKTKSVSKNVYVVKDVSDFLVVTCLNKKISAV